MTRLPHTATLIQPNANVEQPPAYASHPAKVAGGLPQHPATLVRSYPTIPGMTAQRSAATPSGTKDDFVLVTNELKSALTLAVGRAVPAFVAFDGGWEGWFQVEVAVGLLTALRESKREVALSDIGRSDITFSVRKTPTVSLYVHVEMGCQRKTQNTAQALADKMIADGLKYKESKKFNMVILVAAGAHTVIAGVQKLKGEIAAKLKPPSAGESNLVEGNGGISAFYTCLIL